MAKPMRVKEDLAMLRQDADRVIRDISKISKHLQDTSRENFAASRQELQENLNVQIEELRSRAEQINQALREYGQKIDTAVKENPYTSIGAALGLGFVLGKWLLPTSKLRD